MKYTYEVHLHTNESSLCGRTPAREYIPFYIDQGYDGIVVGLRNSGIDNSGKYFIYEYYNETDFLLFRVNNHENGN